MNIVRLNLRAFGPFTGWELDFSAPGLHIVFGPNEAGKSAALRGLKALLFGIDEQTSDNFVHKNTRMRIAGTLRRADGRTLDVVRRKGHGNTLLAPDDTVLDERILVEFLGGVGRDQFTRMFGLGHAELNRGGREIVSGKGDVGESLFAAAVGGRGVQQILKPLEDEAADLYRPRAPSTLVNVWMEQYQQASRESLAASLPAQEWEEHTQLLQDALSRRDALGSDLRRARAEAARLERMGNALQYVGERKQLQAQRTALGQVLLLAPGFPEIRRRTLEDLERSRVVAARSERRLRELQAQIAELTVPEALLEQHAAISKLFKLLGSHNKAMEDIPKLVAEAEQSEADAAAILAEVYPGGNQGPAVRASLGTRQSVLELGGRREALVQMVRKTTKSVDALHAKAGKARASLGATTPPRDPAELREFLKRAQRLGDPERELAKVRARLRAEVGQAEVELKRLPLWTGMLEELEALAVAGEESIERFGSGRAKLELDLAAVESKLKEAQARELDVLGKIKELELTSAVVTEEDLLRARARRERGWKLVRAAWLEGRSDGPAIEEFSGSLTLDAAYEASVHSSDETADRLRREADRVALYAARTAERDRAAQDICTLQRGKDALLCAMSSLQQEWEELWRPAGIRPLPPAEMQSWLRRMRLLVDQAGKVRASREEAESLEARIAKLREEISAVLTRLDTEPPDPTAGLDSLVDRGHALLEAIDATNADRRSKEKHLAELEQQLDDAGREARDAEAALEKWQEDWTVAVRRLELEGTESPEVVRLLLERLQEFVRKADRAADFRKRIDGIRRDAANFSRDVSRLATTVAPDVLELSPDAAVSQMSDRLARARADEATRAQLRVHAAEQQEALARATEEIAAAEASLREMCAAAGCTRPDELEAVEYRSERARKLDEQLETVSKQLLAFAAGGTIEDLVREAQGVDPDELPAQLAQVRAEAQELEAELAQVQQAIGKEKAELARMDGSSRAADAAERAQSSLAQVREGIERYVHLKLAAVVLRWEIERYRARHQGPVLKRASEIFARLTLGSFAGLKTNFDEADRPVLVGVRPRGEELGVDAMSDGTCDQLYLSLRLASLENHLEGRETMPFVIDDILVNFDDARSEATLRFLTELSAKTQIIFFTHHEHLITLASGALPAGTWHRHRM